MIEVLAQTDGQVEGLWVGRLTGRTERMSEGHTGRHANRWQPLVDWKRDRLSCCQLGKPNRETGR